MIKQRILNLAQQLAGKRHDNSIQLRAYHLYQEKGGYALDNWLEAERIFNNDEQSTQSRGRF